MALDRGDFLLSPGDLKSPLIYTAGTCLEEGAKRGPVTLEAQSLDHVDGFELDAEQDQGVKGTLGDVRNSDTRNQGR